MIAVNGSMYIYNHYDEGIKKHLLTEVGIDAEGILTFTNTIIYMTESKISDRGINLTKKQWIGLTKHFLREKFNLADEGIAEKIVDSFATTRVPLVEELPNYIAIYIGRN